MQGSNAVDPWLPLSGAVLARPQSLYLDGVSGALPAPIPAFGVTGGPSVTTATSTATPLVYLAAQS